MIKKSKSPRIFFGWWMNLFMAITSGLGNGFIFLGASALFKPISTELGLTRAVTSLATSISRLEGGIQAPVTGILADKFGPKWLVLGGTFLLVTGFVWMYFVNSVWAYYVAWGLIISTGFNVGFTIAQDKVVTDWFIKKRGLALGVRFALFGIVATITLPVASWLITSLGWREACLIWAFVITATVPLSLLFVRQHRPEYYGLFPDGVKVESERGAADVKDMVDRGMEYAASVQETEFTLKQALKTRPYWILVVSWCAFGLTYGSVTLHFIPFLTDIGIEAGTAAFMLSLMNLINIPTRFIGGYLSDRFRKDRMQLLMAAAFLLQAVAMGILLSSQTIGSIYAFLIVLGLGTGIVTPLGITMRGRYYGRKAYGSIQGTSQLFAAPISIFGPVYTGWVYDNSGSYMSAFTLFAVIAVATAVLMLFLRPPKAPMPEYDMRKIIMDRDAD